MKDIVQYSVDVIDVVDGISAEKIVTALEDAGIPVKEITWKASWTEEDYDEGKPPYSYD